MILTLSSLPHTWIFDLDGTLVEHNGYKKYGYDLLLAGAKELLQSIPNDDMIIFITSREKEYKKMTEAFLIENDIKYDHIIYEVPYGERILVNDTKPSGLKMAYSICPDRDQPVDISVIIDDRL